MAKSVTSLTRIVRQFRRRTIGVLGDFMLDELLRGEATRISPEAPVPVVLMSGQNAAQGFPGGAGNVAANIRALGARAVIEAHPGRIIWLGAYGTGPSARAAGLATRTVLKAMGAELADKVTADAAVLEAGGTVFHSGPFSNNPLSATRRTVQANAAIRF